MTLKIGSLFSGYGGLDAGVSSVLDAKTVWFSEFDKGPSKILAHRFPGVPNHGDITKIDWATVEPVDVLTGGSPCQDLSHAGRRAGMSEGTRSNLWVAMREAIAALRPSLVVWENVRGAYSAGADSELESDPRLLADTRRRDGEPVLRALGRVLGDLSDLGYDAVWHGLRAADVGAPHGRFRVFVIAYPKGDAGRIFDGDGGAAAHADGRVNLAGIARADQRPVAGGDAGSLAGSLLPTPSCSDTNGAGQHGDGGLDLRTAVHLMPTPRATDGTKGGPNQRGSSGDLMLPSAVALLPTPAVNDMGAAYTPEQWDAWTARMKAEHGNGNGHGKSLAIEAQRLLPTPTTEPSTGNGHARNLGKEAQLLDESRCVECGCPEHLHDEGGFCAGRCGGEMCGGRQFVQRLLPTPRTKNNENRQSEQFAGEGGNFNPDRWGDYAAAIARWEHILGRPTPAPTQTSAKGNPQLSAAFVEWLMGLPAGWVTDVPGITRNEALKACGNGVVPQQCAAALRLMLPHIAQERAA